MLCNDDCNLKFKFAIVFYCYLFLFICFTSVHVISLSFFRFHLIFIYYFITCRGGKAYSVMLYNLIFCSVHGGL